MSNRLKNEKSPYLRQHAENPVDWYPWGAEALEKAKREDKPIFLSIGYSTCHWCHVMAKESFEDKDVAAILNRYYVPVKVDREERPDLDSVYMQACVAANGSGGWPLTAILTPEQEPFFVGTYFPKENRGGRMGLRFLLGAIAEKWENERGELEHTAKEMTAYLRQEEEAEKAAAGELPRRAAEQLMSSYDKEYGGFGWSTKFPMAHNLIFLMEQARFGEAVLVLGRVQRLAVPEDLLRRAAVLKADCLFAMGADDDRRYLQALDAYRAVLRDEKLTPSQRLAVSFKIGRSLEKLRRIEEAVDYYYVHVVLAYCDGVRAKTWFDGDARAFFTRAAFILADCYEARGEGRQAVRVLDYLVKTGVPAAREARRRIEQIEKKGGAR